jgi:hypothetical protein
LHLVEHLWLQESRIMRHGHSGSHRDFGSVCCRLVGGVSMALLGFLRYLVPPLRHVTRESHAPQCDTTPHETSRGGQARRRSRSRKRSRSRSRSRRGGRGGKSRSRSRKSSSSSSSSDSRRKRSRCPPARHPTPHSPCPLLVFEMRSPVVCRSRAVAPNFQTDLKFPNSLHSYRHYRVC